MPAHNSLAGQLNGLETLTLPEDDEATHWPAAANSALATILLRQSTRPRFSPTGAKIARSSSNPVRNVRRHRRVGIAVSDAFVDCWHVKCAYNLIRPISYIQANIERGWNNPEITDPVITPPFPEYPSGDSVQSGATAAVLTQLFADSQSVQSAKSKHVLY